MQSTTQQRTCSHPGFGDKIMFLDINLTGLVMDNPLVVEPAKPAQQEER